MRSTRGTRRVGAGALPQKSARNGDKLFLALTEKASAKAEGKKEYKFEFFLASHITNDKYDLGPVVKCWRLGRVVDGNQSKNMITVCVDVESTTMERVQRAWGRA